MEVLFSSYLRLIENIVGIIRMNLRLKKTCFNPCKWNEYYTSRGGVH